MLFHREEATDAKIAAKRSIHFLAERRAQLRQTV